MPELERLAYEQMKEINDGDSKIIRLLFFNNSKNYYCKDTHCIDVDRKDDIDVIYKEVKRS